MKPEDWLVIKQLFTGCLIFVTATGFACVGFASVPALLATYSLAHLWAVIATLSLLPVFLGAVWRGHRRLAATLPPSHALYRELHTETHSTQTDRVFVAVNMLWMSALAFFLLMWILLLATSGFTHEMLLLWAGGATLALLVSIFTGYRIGREPMEENRRQGILACGSLFLLFAMPALFGLQHSASHRAGLLFGFIPGLLLCYAMTLSWDAGRMAPRRQEPETFKTLLVLALALLCLALSTLIVAQYPPLQWREFFDTSILSILMPLLGYLVIQGWRHRPRHDMALIIALVSQVVEASSWSEVRHLVEQHPELRSAEAAWALEDLITSKVEDHMPPLPFMGEQGQGVLGNRVYLMIEKMVLSQWARELAQEHPELSPQEAEQLLQEAKRQMQFEIGRQKEQIARLKKTRRLLVRCREIGIAQAFEEVERG